MDFEKVKEIKLIDDKFYYVITKGIIILFVLFGICIVTTTLSFAYYAATVQHEMSMIDYLYSSNHWVLKFILFVSGTLGGLIFITVSLSTITLLILWKKWKKASVFGAIIVLILSLFTIPFPQNTKMYSAQITIPQDTYLEWLPVWIDYTKDKQGNLSLKTPYYKSMSELEYHLSIETESQFFDFSNTAKVVSKESTIFRPLITFTLPDRPTGYDYMFDEQQ